MSNQQFIRLLGIENRQGRLQGPPVPRWLLDLLAPFAQGEIIGVLISSSRVEIAARNDGIEREIVITGAQWAEIGGPAAMIANGFAPPSRDQFRPD